MTLFQGHTHVGAEVQCGETRSEWQTAPSNEHKKASRDKIRKYKENEFRWSPAILRSCFLPNGTK